jgi:lysozyme
MSSKIPSERPKITREKAEEYFATHGGLNFKKHPLYVLGIRGYYTKSLGDPSKNDFGIYDDCICLITENGFTAFNANTDPSKLQRGSSIKKGTAVLQPGLWTVYGLDLHKGSYPALCQRLGDVLVWRYKADGTRYSESGMFGINIHCGGKSSTNSEGCQTIYPMQYGEWLFKVTVELAKYGWNGMTVPYLLTEQNT